jgi:hypothetical protein
MHRPIKCLYTSAWGKCLAVTAPYPWQFPALPAYGPLQRKACLCACLEISHSIFEPGVATAGQDYYRLGPVVSFCPLRTGLGVPCAAASRRNVMSSRADARRIRNSLGRQARDNRSGWGVVTRRVRAVDCRSNAEGFRRLTPPHSSAWQHGNTTTIQAYLRMCIVKSSRVLSKCRICPGIEAGPRVGW